jgi:hypothetical protein
MTVHVACTVRYRTRPKQSIFITVTVYIYIIALDNGVILTLLCHQCRRERAISKRQGIKNIPSLFAKHLFCHEKRKTVCVSYFVMHVVFIYHQEFCFSYTLQRFFVYIYFRWVQLSMPTRNLSNHGARSRSINLLPWFILTNTHTHVWSFWIMSIIRPQKQLR